MATLLPVTLFNTLSRRIEKFEPLQPGQAGVYCCGPTVYDYQHIGNLRTYIFEDILVRTLRFAGYRVKHVMNVTDVGHLVSDADQGEDKMALAMRREKKKSAEIAEFYTAKFFEDCVKLDIIRPAVVCKATEHIPEMIALIQRIEKNGLCYISNGNVYFDVGKFPNYGQLARIDLEKLQAGARIDVDANKKSPFDFALWLTKSKFENQELMWDSPWGLGYPGWHIECSAMSMKYLGESFDIHCGGIDHIPVHHTNEIAQSEAATGRQWVKYWVHGEFMVVNAEKMSKSKGGFLIVDNFKERGIEPMSYRYMCLSSHYRSQLNFTWEILQNAQSGLQKFKSSVLAVKAQAGKSEPALPANRSYLDQFSAAVCDDLNMPKALASVSAVLADKNLPAQEKLGLLYNFDEVLGLNMPSWSEEKVEVPDEVRALTEQRETARREKNWAEADRLRKMIEERGFSLKDSAGGPTVIKGSGK
jgi:cysteinyl-tRNA synthetase